MPVSKIPESLVDWCRSVLGDFAVLAERSHSHGESKVWHIQSALTQEAYFLKVHKRPGKRERELWAYTHAASVFGTFAPRLISSCEELPQALLLSALNGEPMEHVPLTPAQEQAAWYRAGTMLFRFHAI